MKDSVGAPDFPVCLIADSPPKNWEEALDIPLDPRHPARHNIWSSVLCYMQEALYYDDKRRFDTSKLYIRNAIGNRDEKPASSR